MNKKTERNPKGAGVKPKLTGGKRHNIYIDEESWKYLTSDRFDSASSAIRETIKEKREKDGDF